MRAPLNFRGFTLIEMMVVMVIVSLLITIIMQGFGYSMGVYQRVVSQQRQAYTVVMAERWFQSTLSSQVAARPKDQGLIGSNAELTTYSFMPLIEETGLKTRIGWRLSQSKDELILAYQENQVSLTVHRWPESTGRIEYLDTETGRWIDHWPTKNPDAPSLPKAIRLVILSGSDTRNWLVVNSTRLRPEISMDEMLYGR